VKQARSYLEYSGCGANGFGEAARDPLRTSTVPEVNVLRTYLLDPLLCFASHTPIDSAEDKQWLVRELPIKRRRIEGLCSSSWQYWCRQAQ